MRFSGKIAIITAGAKGIGEATALLLAKECASVAIVDVDMTSLQRVLEALRAGRDSAHEAAGLRPHHQPFLDRRPRRHADQQRRLRDGQSRHPRVYSQTRDRAGTVWYHLQRDRAQHHADGSYPPAHGETSRGGSANNP